MVSIADTRSVRTFGVIKLSGMGVIVESPLIGLLSMFDKLL